MKTFKWILPLAIALISFGSPDANAQSDRPWKHKRVLNSGRVGKFRATAIVFTDRGSTHHPAMNKIGRKTRRENQKKIRSQFPGR